jgi:hypothetical protein
MRLQLSVRGLLIAVPVSGLLCWPLLERSIATARAASGQVTDDDRQFWSFRKAVRPEVPRAAKPARLRTPVDSFVLEKLAAQGLSFAPDADRHTLIRRASLDLTGLPPSPEQIEAFSDDMSPIAYERLVDRLLASPHFGERWGRHWLDVAGYVDTVGFDVDADNIITSEGKWRYRDYVIGAFNEDKTYDRFITEQLAGDELADWRSAPILTPELRRLLIATGFLRTAQDFTHEDVGNIPQNHYAVLHDTLEIVGSSLLGLTLQCARCHDHKFDPIPQDDYYKVMAIFTPAYNPRTWKIVWPYDPKLEDRGLPDVAPSELAAIRRHNEVVSRRVAEGNESLERLRRRYRAALLRMKLAALPEPIRADTRTAVETKAEKRNEVQKYLAGKFADALKVTADELSAALEPEDKVAAAAIVREVAAWDSMRRGYGKLQALVDVGPPPPTFRLVRGNHETPGQEVQPGFLSVLCEPAAPQSIPDDPPFAGTSGRRLALARWLTTADTSAASLVARVLVNRVWQHLLGDGIVASPENLGNGGEPPTHPELLDWLSVEFMRGGWRIKPLIRLIVMSSVYRQASTSTGAVATDPDNHLLGRMRLKRLEAEAVRDALLAVSGRLDQTMNGPPVMLQAKLDGTVVIAERALAEQNRRSVYLLARRAFHLSLSSAFDQPVVATNCSRRDRSAVPLQSLAMLNGAFVLEQAEHLGRRAERTAGTGLSERLGAAFVAALGRRPSADEANWCLESARAQASIYAARGLPQADAKRHALVHVCHVLLNSSEFLYAP